MSMVQEVFKAPVYILIFSFVLEEGIHYCQMVSILADELGMSIRGLKHFILRPEEDVRRIHAGYNGEYFIDAAEFGRGE